MRRAALALLLIGLMAGQRGHAQAPPVAELRLGAPVAPISPLLYGVNYVWHLIPGDRFAQFDAILRDAVHATLVRYPGGWVAERFDWERNGFFGTQRRPQAPGIGPEAFLAAVPQASFVTPTLAAIEDQGKIPAVAQESIDLVRRFGDRVKIWEIGNEWWLARGGKANPAVRAQNLGAYAALVRAEAPQMQAASSGIKIYVTGDWTHPEEFAELRRLVGEGAWAAVAGISFHSYCGPREEARDCARIPEQAANLRSITGKNDIFDSEWAVGRRLNQEDFGIRNGNATVLAVQALAFARVTAATYWPPVRDVAATALICPGFEGPSVTGTLFGWLARYYRGEALRTTGDIAGAAARDGATVTVFVPSAESGQRLVRIPLTPSGLSRVVSAEILYSADPDAHRACRDFQSASLPVTVRRDAAGGVAAEFVVNPGTPGRGTGWEIARVTLQ